ncbi:MAG: endo-1,3-alpha-glucanase family glycosylhydrolase [Pseudomonadota bacterium]|nr:endo-1,3-alpha-glucanase family glycosylhydrolase [Pseudomonadota bacterium]
MRLQFFVTLLCLSFFRFSVAESSYFVREKANSNRLVFAHYITQFPISLDNKVSNNDYYSRQYLTVDGESGKHSEYGGFLRDRPALRKVIKNDHWKNIDFASEIQTAISFGVDGFAVNLLSADLKSKHWENFKNILSASDDSVKSFNILFMPDMLSMYDGKSDEFVYSSLKKIILDINNFKSIYRDGSKIVVAPYLMELRSPIFWKSFVDDMSNSGVDVVLLGVFQGWRRYFDAYSDLRLFGFSDWGTRSNEKFLNYWLESNEFEQVFWMFPVSVQDFRPKSFFYQEAHNFNLMLNSWFKAIESNSGLVHLITWNDYSENSHMAPSLHNGDTLLSLNSFFIQWFKTGKMPIIARDAVFYSYRKHSTDVSPNVQLEGFKLYNSDSPNNRIQALVFSTAPGILTIKINGEVKAIQDVPSGMSEVSIPLEAGVPSFVLSRSGEQIINVKGKTLIVDHVDFQDLSYYFGFSLSEPLKKPLPPLLYKNY